MGLRPLEYFHSYSAGIDFRLQNLTPADVDLLHRYSNEADIYDDFKLKQPFGLHGLYKKYFSALRVDGCYLK